MIKGTTFVTLLLILSLAGTATAQNPTIVWSTNAYTSSVRDISYAADGQSIATVSGLSDSPVKTWSTYDGSLLQSIDFDNFGVFSVDLSSDGENVAAGYTIPGYPPGMLTNVWDLSSQSPVNDFSGAFVAFSPDGNYLASAGGGVYSSMNVQEVTSGTTVFSAYHGSYITAVAYSPTGDVVASGGTNNKIRLWEAATGIMQFELTGHTDDISSLAFSSDGTMLASAEGGFDVGGQSVIKLWSMEQGNLLRTLDGFGSWVHDVEFSPDGQYLISSGRESDAPNLVQKIKIWRLSDGELVQEYIASAYSVEYSPDGQYFAYGSPYGGLYLAVNPFYSGSADLNISVSYVSGSPVPVGGGNLYFEVYIENAGTSPLSFDAWIDISYEGGTPTTVIQRLLTNFPAGAMIDRPNAFFPVPGSYAAGNYLLTGRGGNYPGEVWGESGFPFEKDGSNFLSGFEPFLVDGTPNPFDDISNDQIAASEQFELLGNFPNPFNPETTITFTLPHTVPVSLKIYDISGREVENMVDGRRTAGRYEVRFNGSGLPSGLYIYRLRAGETVNEGKMLMVK
jgi:WD40 repeat protein